MPIQKPGMKILLVHNFYGSSAPSGENTAYEAERELLKSNGHTVIEFTRHSDDIRARGMTGKIIGALSTPWNPFSLRRLRKIIKAERPDITHVHNFFPLISPSAFFAACGSDTASVFTLHNYRIFCAAGIPMRGGCICTECIDQSSVSPSLRYGCYRNSRVATFPLAAMIALHRRLGTWQRHVDAFITLTEFQRRTVVQAGLPENGTYVKPHFYVDPPQPVPFTDREDKAVYIGRLSQEKGLEVLINAWKRLGNNAPLLEIVGDGPDKERLMTSVNEASLANRISFAGQLTFTETQIRLARARALILPSLWFEGFPMVIREAFALGVPVIGSRIGSIPFIVTHAKNGMLFEPGNAEELTNVVAHAFEDKISLSAMSLAARREFEEKYTAEANIEMLVKIYEAAIIRKRGHGRGEHE
jgi:glycosyltransferase involved in cell wall biosynthesis